MTIIMDTDAVAYQLKRVYGDKITDLFARHTQAYNHFMASNRKSSYRPGGVGYYFASRQADIESVGARGQGHRLPIPLPGDGVQGVITPKLFYGTLRLSGLAMEVGKSNTESFAEVQGDAIANLYKSMIVDLNRQCWGDGYGKIAVLSATSDTLSTTVDWTITCNNDLGTRYVRPGMIVDFYESAAYDVSSSTSRVKSINPVTKVITMEANASAYTSYHPLSTNTPSVSAATIASGAVMVRYGARDAVFATTDTAYELTGLLGQYDDGTLIAVHEGITVSSDPEWKANIMGNSSVNRELSIDLLLAALDTQLARSGVPVKTMMMGLGQRRKYFNLLASDIRYGTANFVGGYESLKFSQNGAVEMIVDPVCQPNKIFMEGENIIKKYELSPIGWGGFDPNKMHWRQDYDEAAMYLKLYTNLGVENRRALTLVDDLTEPGNMPF